MLIGRERHNVSISIRLGLRLGLRHIRRIEVVVASAETFNVAWVQPHAPLALDQIQSPLPNQIMYLVHLLHDRPNALGFARLCIGPASKRSRRAPMMA